MHTPEIGAQGADATSTRDAAAAVARVVVVREANATDAFKPRPDAVRRMVEKGVMALSGRSDLRDAWLTFVSTNDVVGLKVFCSPGPTSGTRLPVVIAVIEGLLAAGLPATNIVVWDRQLIDLRLAGYLELTNRYGIRVEAAAAAGYDDAHFYESSLLGRLVWGDHEFGRTGQDVGRKSYVSLLVTRGMTRIINIPPLLNQNQAGVTGNLYSLAMGSVDNTLRFEAPDRMAIAVPEIYNLAVLSDRVALNIVDALICQYEGEQRVLLHYARALNELRFGTDPVALDVLSLQDVERERDGGRNAKDRGRMELYENAALVQLGTSDPRRIQVERVR